jgi:putative ABC transport system permease protein
VGIAEGMTGTGGDPLAFLTVADVLSIQNEASGEAIRLEREARAVRVRGSELGGDPQLLRRARAAGAQIPALAPPPIAAVLVELEPGSDPEAVRRAIGAWPDVAVYTAQEERELLLRGVVERSSRQLGLFRALLVLISAILMGLILYTMTVDKLHSIALLKLLGARRRVVLGMILQESLLLGLLAYGVALAVGALSFEHFPRRIVLAAADRIGVLGVVVAISIAASVTGIRKALSADPNQVLSG